LKIKRLLIPALYLIIVLTMVVFWLTGCTSLRFNKQSERRISLLPTRIRANNMSDEVKHS